MIPEKRICKECNAQFPIEADDIGFYEKCNVPAPVRCPECRERRRSAWRNERVLYRRNCDLCKKSTVTIYSPNKPFKVYCPPCFWSDKWSGLDYGREFDFTKPFFPQWQELQLQVPRIALLTKNSVNSEYTNHSNNNRNCYLTFTTFDSENIMYSANVWKASKDCVDCYLGSVEGGAELCYECVDAARIYGCQYGVLLKDCTDCHYSYDLRGCSNCVLCANLRNKQYCILNTQYTKEEYTKKIKELQLGSSGAREKIYAQFLGMLREKALRKFAVIEKSVNASGNFIVNSKNAQYVFDASDGEDIKYCVVCPDVKNCMDSYHFGFACELIYESHALIHDYDVKFSHLSYDNSHLEYCDSCHNSENLFGCVGIRQGKYSIFNKRYEEGEYATLKEKIIEYMKETGEYGQFFPPQLSPFGYNETQGNIYSPLTKEQVFARGYKWEDLVPGTFGKETLNPENIPDDIKDVPETVVKEALACIQCKRNYNIVQAELDFYRRMEIPVPRLCPECRYRRRLELRLPRKLWHRQCMCDYQVRANTVKHAHHPEGRCSNEFETPYAPERKETVYCEVCYQAEVA